MFCNATFPDHHTEVVDALLYDTAAECNAAVPGASHRNGILDPIRGNTKASTRVTITNCWCDA
jgi:hypothetical protein